MAKYDVKFSCGHEDEVQLFGKVSERERKIAYFEKEGLCSNCYSEMKKIEMEVQHEKEGIVEQEMSYREYKLNYADCKTKSGSYNPETKTIIVYVNPNKEQEEKEAKARIIETAYKLVEKAGKKELLTTTIKWMEANEDKDFWKKMRDNETDMKRLLNMAYKEMTK